MTKAIESPELEQHKVQLLTTLSKMRMESTAPEVKLLYDTLIQGVMAGGDQMQCAQFVANYAQQKGIAVKPNGIYKQGQLVRNHKALFYQIFEAWKTYRSTYKLKSTFSREDVALEFESISEQQWDASRAELQEMMTPQPDQRVFDRLLKQFVTAVCGKRYPKRSSVEFRRCLAFVGHFIWQVQTKLHEGADAVVRQGNEAMLLFFSKQQKTGKSTTVRRLLAPLLDSGFVWKTDFGRLEDQFSMHNLAYNYVAWFDDAGRAANKSMSKFKQLVTDDEVHFRGMYTQTEHKMPKLVTLVGTSNKTARELINDTTGLRRFHQVEVNSESVDTGGGVDLDCLADFDVARLWTSCPLGETNSPLLKYLTPTELREYEEEIRPRHVTELWLEYIGKSPSNSTQGELHSSKDLYQSLVNWCHENGYAGRFVPTSESMGSKLVELGCQRGRSRNYRGYYLQ